jgi:hypothetical protein
MKKSLSFADSFAGWLASASIHRTWRLALGLLACTLAFSLQPSAFSQVFSPTLFPLTNLPPTLAASGVSTTTNLVSLTKNACLSVAGRVNSSLAGGTTALIGSFSIDGTNFGVAPFVLITPTLAVAAPGVTVTVWTNWPQSYLSGFSAVNFTILSNTSTGIATNWGFVVNRATLNTLTY